MSNLLVSLGVGVAIAFISFVLIYKFTRLSGKHVAALVLLAVLGVYVPYAIFAWPGADVFAIHLALFGITPYALGIITSHWEASGIRERKGRFFHWGPAAMVIFFMIIVVVDATIITLSDKGMSQRMADWVLPEPRAGGDVSSFVPGTVSHDYQKKEALYNQHLEQLARQEERGWQVRKGWTIDPVAAAETPFRVEVLDREGQPVRGAEITVEFLRPSDQRRDVTLVLPEVADGVYEAPVVLPLPGLWNVVIRVVRGEDLHELRAMTSLASAPQ